MSEIKVPIPTIPTDDEMIVVSKQWWERHIGINFLDWDETLCANSFPFKAIKLPQDLIERLLSIPDEYGSFDNVFSDFDSIVAPEISKTGWDRLFIKLITRSPKDYIEDFAITNTRQIMAALINSMRCFEDLCLLKYIDKCILIVRPFKELKKKNEFRVFVENKKVVGITQYHFRERFKYSKTDIYFFETKLREFTELIIKNCTVINFVADVIFIRNGKKYTPTLIELNPFGLSDPCLFINYENLDGSFKYVE